MGTGQFQGTGDVSNLSEGQRLAADRANAVSRLQVRAPELRRSGLFVAPHASYNPSPVGAVYSAEIISSMPSTQILDDAAPDGASKFQIRLATNRPPLRGSGSTLAAQPQRVKANERVELISRASFAADPLRLGCAVLRTRSSVHETQAPKSKHQAAEKLQTSNINLSPLVWSLVLGISLELGAWRLVLLPTALGCRCRDLSTLTLLCP
jgi:hypothetical protein